MGRLEAKFTPSFQRDLKKKAKKRAWDLDALQEVIDLVVANTPESLERLRDRHGMHTLKGAWKGSRECHVANAGDWLVIWADDGTTAFFQRTGSHDELFA